MRYTFIILILLISSQTALFSQVNREWVQRFNGTANNFDIVNSMKLDNASNVYVFGSSSTSGGLSDIAVIKYSSSGNLLWSSLFNGYASSVDQANASCIDGAGNSYVTGFTADTNSVIKMVTLKYNNSGSLQWSNIFHTPLYGQSSGNALIIYNNDIYAAGNCRRSNGTSDIYILKYSAAGVLIDSMLYNTGLLNSESVTNLCADTHGNIYLFGTIQESSSPVKGLVLKIGSALNIMWSKIISAPGNNPIQPVQMIMDNQGKPLVCMAVFNTPGGYDYGVYKLDTNSTILNSYNFNGSGNNQDIPYALTTDASDNIYVTGSSRNADTLGSEDVVTVKLNSGLQFVWSRAYNGSSNGIDYGTAVTCDAAGNIYIGGAFAKHSNYLAYALLKYNLSGDLLWMEQYSRIYNSEDFVYSVAVDNSYNVFLTGISFDSLSDFDIATIKYSQPIGIQQISEVFPESFSLWQNYPNPFNPETKIRFSLPAAQYPAAQQVELKVFDAAGKETALLLNSSLKPGVYEVSWNAEGIPSGVYFYKLRSGSYVKTMKMILVK